MCLGIRVTPYPAPKPKTFAQMLHEESVRASVRKRLASKWYHNERTGTSKSNSSR